MEQYVSAVEGKWEWAVLASGDFNRNCLLEQIECGVDVSQSADDFSQLYGYLVEISAHRGTVLLRD